MSLRTQLLLVILFLIAGTSCSWYFFSGNVLLFYSGITLTMLAGYLFLYFTAYEPILQLQIALKKHHGETLDENISLKGSKEVRDISSQFNSIFDQYKVDIAHLKKLERVRNEFLANVSHELRTPIFSTQGLIETLLNGAIDDPKVNRSFLEKALTNTHRLNELLTDLIDISRIESGEMKLRFRFFDVVDLLNEAVKEFEQRVEQLNITMDLRYPSDAQLDVFGDRERIRQVIVNLLDNAIKYSDRNAHIIIALDDSEDKVHISIKDNGIGIPADHLSRIFERFYRINKDRSREVGGTGLGLAIVKHIIEAHNSKISVESASGTGSTFSFFLWKSSVNS
jgi:two-component system phosphate regulon sensor histidine kinase PhoR